VKMCPMLSGTLSQFDERANIKFTCKLGKSAAETLQATQTVCGDNALKKQLCMTGTTASKVGKNCWKASLAVGDFQLV
jgi:hypothetical protein